MARRDRHRFEGGPGEQTYNRWRREYGGMKVDHARRLEELKRGVSLRTRRRRAVSDLTLDKVILTEAARGND